MRSTPAVSICVAVVKPDNHGQNRILAYVVGEGLQVEALREKLQARLPEYMIPEHIVLLDAMPLNRNGKIDRKAFPTRRMRIARRKRSPGRATRSKRNW